MSAWFFPFIYQIQNNDLAPYYPPKVTSFFRIIINWGFSHLWCVWIHFSNYAQIVPSFLRRLLIFRVHFLNLTFELSYNVLASESFWHDLISLILSFLTWQGVQVTPVPFLPQTWNHSFHKLDLFKKSFTIENFRCIQK